MATRLWNVVTTAAPTGIWGGGVVNVKSAPHNAAGNGSTDDTVAIQSAINEAFGPISAPHGYVNRYSNKRLYFPNGKYLVRSPLYITDANGGVIYGEGCNASEIAWNPTGGAAKPGGGFYSGSGNDLLADGITPCLMMDGCKNMRINNLAIVGPDNSDCPTHIVCLYITNSGNYAPASGFIIDEMSFAASGIGVLVGGGNNQGCANGLIIMTYFGFHSVAGLQVNGAGAVNWNTLGGGCQATGSLSTTVPGTSVGNGAASYSCLAGQITQVTGASVSANIIDFLNAGGQPMVVKGGSVESVVGMLVKDSPLLMRALAYRNATPAPSGTGMFVDARLGANTVHISGGGYNDVSGVLTPIMHLGANTNAMIESTTFNDGGVSQSNGFWGSGASKLYLTGNYFQGSYPNKIANFTGTVTEV